MTEHKIRYFRDTAFGFAETTESETSEELDARLEKFYIQAQDVIQRRPLLLVLPLDE